MPRRSSDFSQNVFINCPFDRRHKRIFEALVFTIQIAGFRPRCALESGNAADVRLEKVVTIISDCKFAIHDISRTQLNVNRLPRFNMPFELGLDLGCHRFGSGRHNNKRLLILDTERYRYQEFLSDIAGQDIKAHADTPSKVIRIVRDWLTVESRRTNIPGSQYIETRFAAFQRALPRLCRELHKHPDQLTFPESCHLVSVWLEETEA